VHLVHRKAKPFPPFPPVAVSLTLQNQTISVAPSLLPPPIPPLTRFNLYVCRPGSCIGIFLPFCRVQYPYQPPPPRSSHTPPIPSGLPLCPSRAPILMDLQGHWAPSVSRVCPYGLQSVVHFFLFTFFPSVPFRSNVPPPSFLPTAHPPRPARSGRRHRSGTLVSRRPFHPPLLLKQNWLGHVSSLYFPGRILPFI